MIRVLRWLATPLLFHRLEEVTRQRDQLLRQARRLHEAAKVLRADNVQLRRRLHELEPTQLIAVVSLPEEPTIVIKPSEKERTCG